MQEKTPPKRPHLVVPEEADLEILAKHIEALAAIGQRLSASRLRQETIVLLLSDMTKVGKPAIRVILNALPELAKEYLRR